MRTKTERIEAVKRVLDPEKTKRGAQAWFLDWVLEETGESPGKAGVSRYFKGEPQHPATVERLDVVLLTLEDKACEELARQIEEIKS